MDFNISWKITVPKDKNVEITFHLFNIHNQICHHNWLKIFDAEDNSELHELCGTIDQDYTLNFNKTSIIVGFQWYALSEKEGFLASWRSVPRNLTNEVKPEERVEGYILTFPQSLTVSEEASPEDACLQIFNVDTKGKVFINILSSDNILNRETDVYKEIDYEPDQPDSEKVKCFGIKLPSNFLHKQAVLQINATFDNSDYRILGYKHVKIIRNSVHILIQTDKKEYRPKQKILFRIMKLGDSLKPSINHVLSKVFVKSPSRQTLAQYKNFTLDPRGIGQFEFQLDKEPELGDWEIRVENDVIGQAESSVHSVSFVVNEAVLPKFKVTINGPNVIFSENEKVDFEICGIYTHGSKVKGTTEVIFEHKYYSTIKKKILIKDDNTCGTVSLNQEEIASLSVSENIHFSISAKLSEEGTSIVQETSVDKTVLFTRAKFNFGDSSYEHILGEYPYVIYLKLVEHGSEKPLKGESVEICSRLWRDITKFTDAASPNRFYSYDEDHFFELGQKLLTIKFKETCINETTSDDGSITLGIPLNGLPTNVTKLSVKVTANNLEPAESTRMKSTTDKHDVILTHLGDDSEGKDAHRLTIREKLVEDRKVKFDCEGASNFTVYFQGQLDKTVDLNYVVSSGGSLIASGNHQVLVDSNDTAKYLDGLIYKDELGYINSSLPSGQNVLKSHVISLNRPFPMEGKVTKLIKLLIYTRDIETGKTLSHVREYESESCAPKPKLEWNPSKTNPGQSVSLKIAFKENSLCGYSVIDKSADLIENPNKITTDVIKQLRDNLSRKRIEYYYGNGCKNLFAAAQSIGLHILSDKLGPSCNFLRKCYQNCVPQNYSFRGSVRGNSRSSTRSQESRSPFIQAPSVEIRDYFPETWLFDLVDLEDNKEAVIEREAPHSITTWVAEAFCSNLETGLSVAETVRLKVSQDFFADLNAPYAAKRGEILQVNATVFNKVQGPLPMKISLESSEDYKVLNKSEEIVCVNPGGNIPVDFYVEPNKLDVVNITVKTEIIKDDACGLVAEESIGYTDVLKKAINVRPEGFPQEVVKSYFLCKEQKDTKLEDTILPDSNLVEDSVRAWFGISGDIMAPAVKNLDRLVALPTGCGEQTMIRMVPNIYLLDYLSSIGKSLPMLEEKARRYIQTGFDRQNRKFRHRDGAYSIWGPRDSEVDGSMWLTAYVVKAFSQASKYIDMDKDLLKKSVKWIIKRQDFETGCFHNEGYAYSVNSPRETLTSHVLVTLFEARYTAGLEDAVDSKVLHKALRCLKESQKSRALENNEETPEEMEEKEGEKDDEQESLYALSLKTYAVHLLETQDDLKKEIAEAFEEIKGEELLKELRNRSSSDDRGFINWNSNSSRSRSVEMTAYNVMTLLFNNERLDALSAIRWMSDYRNQRGGFISTQDTVVALQAISRYSTLVFENNTSLDVQFFNETSLVQDFPIDEDNKLLFKRIKIDDLTDLKLSSSGKGCYTFSTMVRFNTKNESEESAKFIVRSEGNSSYLHICANYIGENPMTNMVLLEVELLSGYEVVENSLFLLLNELDSDIEKYEMNEEERTFVLYFNGLKQGENHCWDFEHKRVNQVENLKPALIKIYDYYSQEDAHSTTYLI